MAKINKITLNRYRNFKSYEIAFNEKNNIIYGSNGSGKTNILESISLLGKGRGFRNSSIEDLIYKNENEFLVESEIEKDFDNHNIKIYSKLTNNKYKKISSVNNEVSKEASVFLEQTLSFLYFLPEMERLFVSSPSYRRNFIDKLIFSENKNYNKLMNKYKKNLTERNKILQLNNFDSNWISAIENEIAISGLEIYRLRNEKIEILNNELLNLNKLTFYPFSVKFEHKDIFYKNNIDKSEYLKNLKNFRNIDSQYGGTKIGPHKSDFLAKINSEISASKLSTGQQKTLVLITIYAQCKHLINQKNIKPILLFDEICSHLDETNRKILLELSKGFDIQFFFTGTEKSLFSFMSTNTEFYNIKDI